MKIQYPISSNYIKHWGVWEGVREFIQNAMDCPPYVIHYEYPEDNSCTGLGILIIENKGDISHQMLLLGESDKSKGSRGQFGEGLKLAMLVFARLGRAVTIRTKTETWTPYMDMTRDFHNPVLTVDVKKSDFSDTVVIKIPLKHEEWQEIQGKFLDDNTPRVLDTHPSGTIFVGGLYVCKLDGFDYAYNLSPEHIELNRDRDIPSTIDIQFEAARLLPAKNLLDAALDGKMDAGSYAIEYTASHAVYHAWEDKYPDTTPVGIKEQDIIGTTGKYRIVPDWLAMIIRKAGNMVVSFVSKLSPEKRLEKWIEKWQFQIPQDAKEELYSILKSMNKNDNTIV